MNIFYGGSKMQHKEALDILNRFVFEKLDYFKDSKEIKSLIILEHTIGQLEKENQELKNKLQKEVK